MIREIRHSLRALIQGPTAVATGDLTHDFRLDRSDEFGIISGRLAEMTAALRSLVQSVQQAAEQLADRSPFLREGVTTTSQLQGEIARLVDEVDRRRPRVSSPAFRSARPPVAFTVR